LINGKIHAMAENIQNLTPLPEKRNKTLEVISWFLWKKEKLRKDISKPVIFYDPC